MLVVLPICGFDRGEVNAAYNEIELADLLDYLAAMMNCLLVLRQHLPRTLGQRVFQTLHDVLHFDDGAYFEITAQNHRVEELGLTHAGALGRSIDRVDADVGTHRMTRNTVGVIDKHAAGLYHSFELLHRLLVEHYGHVELVSDRRRDRLVGQHDRYVGRTAAHLGSV